MQSRRLTLNEKTRVCGFTPTVLIYKSHFFNTVLWDRNVCTSLLLAARLLLING